MLSIIKCKAISFNKSNTHTLNGYHINRIIIGSPNLGILIICHHDIICTLSQYTTKTLGFINPNVNGFTNFSSYLKFFALDNNQFEYGLDHVSVIFCSTLELT